MTYFKVSSLKIFFLVAIFITGCGGGGGTSNNTDEIDTTSDRPTFNRELAAKAPFYSPSGSITNTKPSFKWLPVPNATDYRLGYEDTDTATNWIERTESASNANCNVLCSLTFVGTPFSVGDEKAWWVRPKVNGIWLDWSRANIFEIIDTVNSNTNPEVISPIGEISTVNPEFSWTSVSNVSRYNFGFESPNNQSDWKSYMLRPSEINCSETSCSFTPTDSGLVVGDIKRWWVRAESNYVWGEWSEGSDFSIEDSNSAARPFIITVKGYERSGRYATVQRDFTINTDSRYSYNYNVDCDSDGTLEASNLSSDYTCVFNDQAPNFNEHSVSISGQFPAFTQANTNFYGPISNNSKMIISVNQWGSQVWRTMENAFYDSSLETIKATDTPNLTQVESLHGMFRQSTFPKTVNDGANNLVNWNVSNVTDMSQMFYRSFNANPDISTWDVSNVKDLSGMFYNANAFNQDIGNWDVSNVTKINGLFEVASTFNQDIGNWNTSNIKEMIGTFASARAFNQNISNWDVNNVTNMYGMFSGAEKFNQDIGAWNVSNVINMQSMFNAARAFNQDIGNWDVSSVTDMTGMFNFANAFNQNIGSWDVSNVRSMKGMFGGYAGGTTNAKVFNQPIG